MYRGRRQDQVSQHQFRQYNPTGRLRYLELRFALQDEAAHRKTVSFCSIQSEIHADNETIY